MEDKIKVTGAREHNLKNINLEIPRDQLVVITGLSGSGKSSLAFDTLYAEGQRRYVECLSAYARQFLDLMERPDVDQVEGLSPAISIEQKILSRNPRSTVGTITEIYDYLRLLFARVGVQHCVNCGNLVKRQSTDQIINTILALPKNTNILLLAPVVKARKGHYRELFQQIQKDGFVKVRIDGEIKDIQKDMQVSRYKIHDIDIVIDRLMISNNIKSRVSGSVETALRFGEGVLIVSEQINPKEYKDQLFSQKYACPTCQISYDEPAPMSFSYSSRYGACPACEGIGEKPELDIDAVIPDKSLSIASGAITFLDQERDNIFLSDLKALSEKLDFKLTTPINKLPKDIFDTIMYGNGEIEITVSLIDAFKILSKNKFTFTKKFFGLTTYISEKINQYNLNSDIMNTEKFLLNKKCSVCNGKRLKKESLAILIDGTDISSLTVEPLTFFLEKIKGLKLNDRQQEIAHLIFKEIISRTQFMIDVGLDYLTLDRRVATLSNGEAQRIRLAAQIGSQLTGVLYILDEPSIGLHQRDNIKLIDSLKQLRDLGNSVIVVEHDKEMMQHADYIIDLGPGAGEYGGQIVTSGKPDELKVHDKRYIADIQKSKYSFSGSLTASYLKNELSIEVPKTRRKGNCKSIVLTGASGNNLKNITVKFPLGKFICVTGVSGSGKSTLILETFYPILQRSLNKTGPRPLSYKKIEGIENIDKVIDIDQSPIGRTPRSNPATYTNLFTIIRDIYTNLPESKIRGYKAGRFSFNVKGGRCEDCNGGGMRKIEMNFLPDVFVKCETCEGKRYNKETLEVLFKGKSISEVLEMTVSEAMDFFSEIPKLARKIETLYNVGLGYIRLGQQAPTLSGGEAQRVKLATELSKTQTGNTLYLLDEPTTGLHFEDIRMLLKVLNNLVELGNTVIVIEHNLDVIKCADWIIDIGPEAGNLGGEIVAEGTPENIVKIKNSHTGKFLKKELPYKE
jgi:excinuclease ABC subunit A